MIADVPPPDDTPEEPLIEYGEYEECDDEPVDLTQLKTRRDGPSGTIILNRPDVRNALSRLTIRELTQAFDEFHRTHGIRGIILAASGSTFCAGTDLKELSEGVGDPEFFKQWHDDAKQVQGLLEKMLQLPVPIIAAVADLWTRCRSCVGGGYGRCGPGSDRVAAGTQGRACCNSNRAAAELSPRSGARSAIVVVRRSGGCP